MKKKNQSREKDPIQNPRRAKSLTKLSLTHRLSLSHRAEPSPMEKEDNDDLALSREASGLLFLNQRMGLCQSLGPEVDLGQYLTNSTLDQVDFTSSLSPEKA